MTSLPRPRPCSTTWTSPSAPWSGAGGRPRRRRPGRCCGSRARTTWSRRSTWRRRTRSSARCADGLAAAGPGRGGLAAGGCGRTGGWSTRSTGPRTSSPVCRSWRARSPGSSGGDAGGRGDRGRDDGRGRVGARAAPGPGVARGGTTMRVSTDGGPIDSPDGDGRRPVVDVGGAVAARRAGGGPAGGRRDVRQGCGWSGTSATELAWVATGRTSASLAFGNAAWDVVAGVVLVREAGGVVLDARGEPWSLASDSILAAASPEIADAMVAAVARGVAAS